MKSAVYVGKQVQQERLSRGWGEEDLGRRIGLSVSEIESLEDGNVELTIKILFSVANVFGKRLRWFVEPI